MHQVAQEEGDAAQVKALALLIELGRFRVCPECRDKFADRDDCGACQSLGIVPKDL